MVCHSHLKLQFPTRHRIAGPAGQLSEAASCVVSAGSEAAGGRARAS
jgi:hypothetical protein